MTPPTTTAGIGLIPQTTTGCAKWSHVNRPIAESPRNAMFRYEAGIIPFIRRIRMVHDFHPRRIFANHSSHGQFLAAESDLLHQVRIGSMNFSAITPDRNDFCRLSPAWKGHDPNNCAARQIGYSARIFITRDFSERLRCVSSRIFLRSRRFFGVASTYSSEPMYSSARSSESLKGALS